MGLFLAAGFADPATAPTLLVNVSNIAWFGNTVAIEFKSGCPMHCRDKQTAKLVEALAKPQESAIRLNLGAFGLKILPILRALDQELSLGLSLKEIEQQLEKRVQSESATA